MRSLKRREGSSVGSGRSWTVPGAFATPPELWIWDGRAGFPQQMQRGGGCSGPCTITVGWPRGRVVMLLEEIAPKGCGPREKLVLREIFRWTLRDLSVQEPFIQVFN